MRIEYTNWHFAIVLIIGMNLVFLWLFVDYVKKTNMKISELRMTSENLSSKIYINSDKPN
jgi:hypothetical protein